MPEKNNDMAVLKSIVKDPRASNLSIAKSLDLSAAGVGKIREKLEEGTIKGYETKVDLRTMDLNNFVLLHVRVTPEGWTFKGGRGVQDLVASNPNIVQVFKVPGRNVNLIMLCVFRSIEESDRFLHAIQSQLADYLEIVESFVFSNDSIIKDTYKGIMLKIIDEGDEKRMPEPVLFGKILGDK